VRLSIAGERVVFEERYAIADKRLEELGELLEVRARREASS
jgi:hypothetical protein